MGMRSSDDEAETQMFAWSGTRCDCRVCGGPASVHGSVCGHCERRRQSAHLGLCAISAAITMIMLAAVTATSDTEILHYLPDEDREDGERLPDEFDVDSLFRAIAQAAP